jgi:hypothetical protein
MKYIIIGAFILTSMQPVNAENLSQRLAEKILGILQAPTESYVIRDLREKYSTESGKPPPLTAFSLRSRNDDFVDIEFSMGNIGRAFSPEMLKAYDKLAERQNGSMQKINCFEDAYAYAGGIFAKTEDPVLYIGWPSRDVEMALGIRKPSDGLKKISASNKQHLKIVKNGIDKDLADSLIKAFKPVLLRAATGKIESDSMTESERQDGIRLDAPQIREKGRIREEKRVSGNGIWDWGTGIFVVICLTIMGLYLGKKKTKNSNYS